VRSPAATHPCEYALTYQKHPGVIVALPRLRRVRETPWRLVAGSGLGTHPDGRSCVPRVGRIAVWLRLAAEGTIGTDHCRVVTPDEAHRSATALELFYDLMFVVAFGTAADQLAHY
jgi:hypothetical protein